MTDPVGALVEERGGTYGPPELNHERTALLWSAYVFARYGIAVPIVAEDVCWMAVLQKISREMWGGTEDGPRDVQGYARNVEMIRAANTEDGDGSQERAR